MIYLQQYLAQQTKHSRRQAIELIRSGLILVDGQVGELGMKVDPNQVEVKLKGKLIKPIATDFVYYALNKPVGYLCAVSDKHHDLLITSLVPAQPAVYPVGRLDKLSQGLIFLTNDGYFTQLLTHPRYQVLKEYFLELAWLPGRQFSLVELQKKILKGVALDDGFFKVDQLFSLSVLTRTSSSPGVSLRVVIHSGRNRILRRFFKKLGLEVLKLERVKLGSVSLDLAEGAWRSLSKSEVVSFQPEVG